MDEHMMWDVAVIGGGAVGLATARALADEGRRRVVVVEAESSVAQHQTGHNSGVIHSGLYYKPGSLKARNCVEGRDALYRFCAEHGVKHERCGKIVVAVTAEDLPALAELERRGVANGLDGMRRLTAAELREHEPEVAGVEGLFVPQTGIVDFVGMTEVYARHVCAAGGEVRTSTRFTGLKRDSDGLVLETNRGVVRAKGLVNCAGLQCDRVARLCGVEPGVAIIPFRGEYYEVKPDRQHLVRNLIYPVPDPRFPFLGVHFTRMVKGGLECGPNAVLAFRREGYRKTDFSLRDTLALAGYSGFWRMASRYWRMAAGEFHRSFSKPAFVQALQRLLPAIRSEDLVPAGAGVRAQAVTPEGRLVDDFCIVEAPRMIHVLNAPSPAATASLAIGRAIAEQAARVLA